MSYRIIGNEIPTNLCSKDSNRDIRELSENLRFGNEDKGLFVLAPDGSVRLLNSATSWDDLRIPIERTKKIADKAAVDVAYKGGVVVAFQYSKEEGVSFNVQMPHSWKEGSDINFHIHYVLPDTVNSVSTENVKFKFSYSWANIHEAFPEPTVLEKVIDVRDSVADVSELLLFPDLDATGKTLSSQLICSLVRDITVADNYGDDIYLIELDFHYQIDGFGSEDVFIKETFTVG